MLPVVGRAEHSTSRATGLALMSLALSALLLLRAAPAHAWACADQPAAALESPRRANAPLNVHLRVRFTSKPTAADLAEITLRSKAGTAVEFDARELPEHAAPLQVASGFSSPVLMELVPRRPLEPNTEYKLTWKMSPRAQRVFPAPMHGVQLSVGKFMTGSKPDFTAPSVPTSLPSVLVDRGWVQHSYKSDGPGPPPVSRLRAFPQVLVQIGSVSDDLTPKDELYYWAWRVGDERAAFSLSRARTSAGPAVLAIGDGEPAYECETAYAFPFPPKAERRFILLVIAVDLAGNVSSPRYLLVDRAKQKRAVPKAFAH